jgi:hypothetical protein
MRADEVRRFGDYRKHEMEEVHGNGGEKPKE